MLSIYDFMTLSHVSVWLHQSCSLVLMKKRCLVSILDLH